MGRRAHAYLIAVLVVSVSALALPQLGMAAGSGGASVSGSGGSSPSSTPHAGQIQPGNQTVSASGSGMTIVTRATAMLRNQLRFTGAVPRSQAGKFVEIERLGPQTGWTWSATTHGRVHRNGSFSAVWPTNHIGRFQIRAVILSGGARAASASPTVTVTVYRQSIATIYGPGFWNKRTACGETLTRHTLGTANRTLPCGTLVSIYYGGQTITVPVIDRGPYANGADWDLTEATAHALHMNATATIGAVSLPRR